MSLKRPPSRYEKKNSVLKKNRKIAEKKIPRQIFVDKIFRCLLKSTKQKYVLRPQKKIFEATTTTLPEALLKTKTKNLKIFLKREKFLVIFAKKKILLCPINDYLLISMLNIWYDYINIF